MRGCLPSLHNSQDPSYPPLIADAQALAGLPDLTGPTVPRPRRTFARPNPPARRIRLCNRAVPSNTGDHDAGTSGANPHVDQHRLFSCRTVSRLAVPAGPAAAAVSVTYPGHERQVTALVPP